MTRKEEYLNDLIHDAAYEAVKQSPLFDSLESNSAVDAKADELAEELKAVIQRWIDRECGSWFLLEHEPLMSVSEAVSL